MSLFFKNFLVIFTILYISRSSSITDKYVVLGVTVLLLVYTLLKKEKFSYVIIVLLSLWMLINIFALALNGGASVPFFKVISFGITYFLYPYLILKIIGVSFWHLFEKWVFIFTKISIPIFTLNFFYKDLFDSLYSIFSSTTNPVFAYPYWSSLFYVNAVEYESQIRNNGFMWEPGAFAMIIIFAIIYNWLVKGIKYDKRFFIYIFALITTVSTAGFIAVAILIAGSLMKKLSLINVLVLSILAFIFANQIYQQDFLKGKLNVYLETYKKDQLNYSENYGLYKVNRLQGAYYSVKETIEYPLGYGVIEKKDYSNEIEIYGTNGLGSMLKMWGIILFFYFLFLLRKMLFFFDIHKSKRLLIYFMYVSLLVMFFSNPISRNVFIYLIILTPLLFKKETIKSNKN